MGVTRAIARAFCIAVIAVLASRCHREPPVVDVGAGWFVDQGLPKKAADRLFYERDGKRVVVDRRIDGYRLYARFCLVYETFRPEGHVVFAVTRGLTPIGISTSDEFERWRIDTDGLRRFAASTDPDGRKLLASEWIDYSDICYVAQEQPIDGLRESVESLQKDAGHVAACGG